ncbi:hypothetical protein K493DRAFT_304015 [Basidiobolus meristosporus CBS 931.73]|uniref:Uncharacterized protein n=1 Tax=Basidiobolus meristosporus CBS 931.73 TaxID=1314790 RepID=A0A1Y1Y0P6_9FUNG|nr:hypothetical protein K493DRAFT_304015 [Basidiobolus meristosporus CBS 931.73]|eukprot:ORX91475.1 hypothetical protein K493DRAFT_304015 [Basidiobolus meristosporus CBS 931.73]
MRFSELLLPLLLVSISVSFAAIPDLSNFRDNEPDIVQEMRKLHNEKVLPVIKEVTKEILRPEFDAMEALRKLKRMKEEYQNEGESLIEKYSSQARYRKTQLHQVNKIVTSEILVVTNLLKKAALPKAEEPYFTLVRRKNETIKEL